MKIEGPMTSCFQFDDVSVLDHGLSVRSWYEDLEGNLIRGRPLSRKWRLPGWTSSPSLRDRLSSVDDGLARLYQVYHDCGKPLCRAVDRDGRQHFPGHAETSRRTWLDCSDGSPESIAVADLIGMDMDVHLLRSDGVAEFAARPQAALLLATGLAELHSNAQMFGGVDSVGFRIKHERISRLGARIVETMR